jgi:hypothetical protein
MRSKLPCAAVNALQTVFSEAVFRFDYDFSYPCHGFTTSNLYIPSSASLRQAMKFVSRHSSRPEREVSNE